MRLLTAALSVLLAGSLAAPASAEPADPARDAQNMADSYGRITGPGGQLQNPAYLPALVAASTESYVAQLLTQVASPTRLALTAGNLVPGWNVGNPLRAGWSGTRGQSKKVAFTNRYGALLRGTVYRPLPGARDPYTGRKLTGPFPGVVLTEGSIQGSEGMYTWLAQDLAERGYVVLTYDVQGQGTSETLPHEESPLRQESIPFCNPLDCPGFPSQQLDNFVVGTEDALDFFTSNPNHHYPNEMSDGASSTSPYNPFWRSYDRDPGLAIIGHSLGATAVTQVQATDDRVATVVALDKLDSTGVTPRVPALAIQSEYFFEPTPVRRAAGPGPRASHRLRRLDEGRGRLDARRAAGVDAPGVHRHSAGAAGEQVRPGAHQRLRAALAGPLPQAPLRRAAARHGVPLPRADRRRQVVAGPPRPGREPEHLLLLGVLPRRREQRRHHGRRLLRRAILRL